MSVQKIVGDAYHTTLQVDSMFLCTRRADFESELGRLKLFAEVLVDKTELLWGDQMRQLNSDSLVDQHNTDSEQIDVLARELLQGIGDLFEFITAHGKTKTAKVEAVAP